MAAIIIPVLLIFACGSCAQQTLTVTGADQAEVEAVINIVGTFLERPLLEDLSDAGATIVIGDVESRANAGTLTAYVTSKTPLAHSPLIHEVLHLAGYLYGWSAGHNEPGIWAQTVDDSSAEARAYRKAW